MGIFTEEEGLVRGHAVLTDHVGHGGVHAAVDVGLLVHALVVDDASVDGLHGVVHGRDVGAAAGLVTHAPEDDGGVVLVALHHADAAVDVGAFPRRVAGEAVVAVTLLVGLVHDVDAVVVVEGVHLRVVGVVAGADGVEVVAFEE